MPVPSSSKFESKEQFAISNNTKLPPLLSISCEIKITVLCVYEVSLLTIYFC
jgi:hypothetical protein